MLKTHTVLVLHISDKEDSSSVVIFLFSFEQCWFFFSAGFSIQFHFQVRLFFFRDEKHSPEKQLLFSDRFGKLIFQSSILFERYTLISQEMYSLKIRAMLWQYSLVLLLCKGMFSIQKLLTWHKEWILLGYLLLISIWSKHQQTFLFSCI